MGVVVVVTVEMGLRSPRSRPELAALLPAMVVRVMVVTEVTIVVMVLVRVGRSWADSARLLCKQERVS